MSAEIGQPITADLRTLRLIATCSDGEDRRIIIDADSMPSIIALVGRIFTGTVEESGMSGIYDKPVVVKPGVRMDDAAIAVGAFIREVASGKSGEHSGRRHGVVFGIGDGDPKRYVYVYQTDTQIVVWY